MINSPYASVEITDHIIAFRNFLNACWNSIDKLMYNHDWDNDGRFIDEWLQANWEFLVERELMNKNFLSPLSTVITSKRITNSHKKSSHVVIAKSKDDLYDIKNNKKIKSQELLRLGGFSTLRDKSIGLYPPFDLADLVLESSRQVYYVPISALQFYIIPIKFYMDSNAI